MDCDFFVSLDAEAADGVSRAGGDWLLAAEIFEHFGGYVRGGVPLVSLSPDSPTLIFSTSLSILISLIGFSFSAWGFFATFLDMWAKIYQLNIINQYFIFMPQPFPLPRGLVPCKHSHPHTPTRTLPSTLTLPPHTAARPLFLAYALNWTISK